MTGTERLFPSGEVWVEYKLCPGCLLRRAEGDRSVEPPQAVFMHPPRHQTSVEQAKFRMSTFMGFEGCGEQARANRRKW